MTNTTTIFRREIIRLLVLVLFFSQATKTLAERATIAVASNFQGTFKILAKEFRQYSEHDLRVIVASTGTLFNQITHGAPFDVLLAADSVHPEQLEKKGLGIRGSRFTYGIGRLALVLYQEREKPPNNQASKKSEVLTDLLTRSSGKVAIANPKFAPFGIAAQQTLEYLDLWDAIQPRLVLGANIAQSFQFVSTGNAGSGLVALSQVLSKETPKKYWEIPTDWHQPIRQQAILLQSGRNNKAALDFLNFLKKQQAKSIIKNQGYYNP
ncbi:MAG: molybdate transport system substrate-binding protein [Oceanicoccus sp.]|jgi:molybdate transport system substrate-binding protein